MLKKLRIKFILINMTIVTVMMAVIFGMMYVSTAQNLERESIQMMRSLAMAPKGPVMPGQNAEGINLPYFTIRMDRESEEYIVDNAYFDISDEEYVQTLIEKTIETGKVSGVLGEYNLRFFISEYPLGTTIVYTDSTSEHSILQNMIRSFVLVFVLAFLGFIAISVLLARWAVRPVEKAWQQQKQFIADASHELKTPLTVIMTDTELLQSEECSDEERKSLVSSILTMSEQMKVLVQSMLELARIDSGNANKQKDVINFSEIASEASMIFEPVFFEHEIMFSYDIEENIKVRANSVQLKQLCDVLLDNASKYAIRGGDASLSLAREGSKKCLLSVSDRGEEIPEEERALLFRRFYRADKSRSRNSSFGLGLSIAASVVSEHNGKIRVESKNGYNTFIVELPTV